MSVLFYLILNYVTYNSGAHKIGSYYCVKVLRMYPYQSLHIELQQIFIKIPILAEYQKDLTRRYCLSITQILR